MTPTLDLDRLRLSRGGHDPGGQMCVMEAVAYVAGEPWSDEPECASRVIGAFLRAWNDGMDDGDRQMLVPLIPRLVGTAASEDVERARSFLALDWLVRTATPAWLRLAGLTERADALAALPELTSAQHANAAVPVIRAARDAAWAAAWDAGDAARAAAWAAARDAARAAAWAAAWDAGAAAWAAAGDAAGDAARAAAWAAARDAARDAAGDAAWDAAWDAEAAARDAARDALRPTVIELQQSALALVDRMIQLAEVPA